MTDTLHPLIRDTANYYNDLKTTIQQGVDLVQTDLDNYLDNTGATGPTGATGASQTSILPPSAADRKIVLYRSPTLYEGPLYKYSSETETITNIPATTTLYYVRIGDLVKLLVLGTDGTTTSTSAITIPLLYEANFPVSKTIFIPFGGTSIGRAEVNGQTLSIYFGNSETGGFTSGASYIFYTFSISYKNTTSFN